MTLTGEVQAHNLILDQNPAPDAIYGTADALNNTFSIKQIQTGVIGQNTGTHFLQHNYRLPGTGFPSGSPNLYWNTTNTPIGVRPSIIGRTTNNTVAAGSGIRNSFDSANAIAGDLCIYDPLNLRANNVGGAAHVGVGYTMIK